MMRTYFNLKQFAIVLITIFLLYIINASAQINWGLSSGIIALAFLLIILVGFETRELNINYLVMVATLSAFSAISRIIFVGIASFQPMTFIVMIIGYTWGGSSGFLVGMVGAFVSNLYLGQGPWTPWQIIGWGLCGVLAGFLGKNKNDLKYLQFVFLAGLAGLFFGLIMNLWHWVAFTYPLNWAILLAILSSSLPFDIMHSVGNILFALVLARPFYQILRRFKKFI